MLRFLVWGFFLNSPAKLFTSCLKCGQSAESTKAGEEEDNFSLKENI